MPTFGGAALPEATSSPFPGIEFELGVSTSQPTGDVYWDAASLTFDETSSAVATQADPSYTTLRDLVAGNEWRLRRIVGKAFIWTLPNTKGASGDVLADVALGFIVCRTDDTGAPQTDFDDVNPLSQESMEDPWIWRRRWLLNPAGPIDHTVPTTGNLTNSFEYSDFPASNARYGSVADGPHIDSKSNRVIHRSERLFAVFAARKHAVSPTGVYRDFTARCLLDYRLLGSLKASSIGNRGNTSR